MNLLDAIREAGIVGAGGAGFPTHVKLKAKAEWFIVNAAECEPLIDTDKYLCRTYADRIVAAAVIVAGHLQAEHTVIALKKKYRAEIDALRAAIDKAGAAIEICEMGVFYPAGDEQTMVQFVTGKTVPERGLPLDVGAVVDNVGTLLGIYDAMTEGKSVSSKYLSVVGEVREPIMIHTPIGTPITQCIEAAKPHLTDYAVIVGGPMMGRVLSDREAIRNAVVTKTTGNLIVLPRDHYLITRAGRPMAHSRTGADGVHSVPDVYRSVPALSNRTSDSSAHGHAQPVSRTDDFVERRISPRLWRCGKLLQLRRVRDVRLPDGIVAT